MPAFEWAPEAILNHGVDHRTVSHAKAFANAWQEVGTVAHRLHTAGNGNVDVARLDTLLREHHCFQSGAADLVDRECGDVVTQPAVERGLPRRRLTLAGGHDVAHDALIDGNGIDAGASNSFADNQRAELRRGEFLECAEKLAGGEADGADDDSFTHRSIVQPSNERIR